MAEWVQRRKSEMHITLVYMQHIKILKWSFQLHGDTKSKHSQNPSLLEYEIST